MKPRNLLVVMFVALAALTSCGGQNEDSVNLSYAPWTDLSAYFNLSSVKKLEGSNILTFNNGSGISHTLSYTDSQWKDLLQRGRVSPSGIPSTLAVTSASS